MNKDGSEYVIVLIKEDQSKLFEAMKDDNQPKIKTNILI